MSNLYGCTCGPYSSVIPPDPCPIHDPERAYWRLKLLQEFGGYDKPKPPTTTTGAINISDGDIQTGTLNSEQIKKYEPPAAKEPAVHYNNADMGSIKFACGASTLPEDVRWARVYAWVTCEMCKRVVYP